MNGRRETAFSPRKLIGKTRHHLRPPATFEDSVDEANPVDIDYKANPWWRSRYSCWEVKGQIAEEYKALGPRIYDELRQSCRESSLEVFVWPYMVGKSTKNARPVLVIASEDETSREEAKAAIERSDILKEHPHFKLWPLRYLPTGPVNPVAMEDHAPARPLPSTESFEVYYNPAERLRPIGMPIYIKHGRTTVRRATANAVHNGTEYSYLTAAHALMRTIPQTAPSEDSQNHFEFPFDSDSDSESSDNVEIEASSLYSGTSPEPTETGSSSTTSSQRSETSSQSGLHVFDNLPVITHGSLSPDKPSADVSTRQNLDAHSAEPSFTAELELLGIASASYAQLDCAVVRVTNEAVLSFFRRLKNVKRSVKETVRVSGTRRASVTAWTSRGPIQGNLLDLPLYMRFAGSPSFQPVYKFTYDGDILMGDCGTLLVDTQTKEVYGHVVADSQRRRAAFIISAEPVFSALKRDGNWQLLTLDTDATLQTSNELWGDLVWDSEPELLNSLFKWDFATTDPPSFSILESYQSMVQHENPSATSVLADLSSMEWAIPAPPSIAESLFSRESISWSSERLSYTTTAPSSLGDRDELTHYGSFDPGEDAGYLPPEPTDSPRSRGQRIEEFPQVDHRSSTFGSSLSNPSGWVPYRLNSQTSMSMASSGRRQRGRTRGLTVSQRKEAALMRVIKACSNCRMRKERCDPGTPCKSCLDHYKGDLIHQPCRNILLSELSNKFLDERISWHPGSRPIESFIASDKYRVNTGHDYAISLTLGFGSSLQMSVHGLEVTDANLLIHEHVVYAWPPNSSRDEERRVHVVLPAVLTSDVETNIQGVLDAHLFVLVMHHFRAFPLYCSPLRVLRDVYVFFRSLESNTSHSLLLMKALKLLVLVHVGGDISVPHPSTDAALDQLVRTTMPTSDATLTPCFIRAQFGTAMPSIALRLMKEVLSSLEQLLLGREPSDWPVVLATLLVILMTIESIQCHAAKRPYHEVYTTVVARPTLEDAGNINDDGVQLLLAFYSACYSGCHAKLDPDWKDEVALGLAPTPESKFTDSIREAVKGTGVGAYLKKKAAKQQWDGVDMSFFFDRLVARLLVTKP